MDPIQIVTGIAIGASTGAAWGVLNFFHNQKKNPKETFDAKRLASTLIVYGGVGAGFTLTGLGENLELFETITSVLATSEVGTIVVRYVQEHLK